MTVSEEDVLQGLTAGAQIAERKVALGQPRRERGDRSGRAGRGDAVLAGALLDDSATQGGAQRGHVETGRSREADLVARAGRGECGGRTRSDDVTPVDDRYDVGGALGLVEIVRGQQHARAIARQAGDDVADNEARLWVDARGRLIEKHDVGSTDEGEGQGEALLLAAGQAPPRRLGDRRQTDPVEQTVGVFRVRVVRRGEMEGIATAHAGVHPAPLEHYAHARRQLLVVRAGIQAENSHLAGCRLAIPLERLDRAGLARAIGSEDCVDLARFGAERHAVDCSKGAVPNDERRDLDGGHGSAG
jgi:hypothetical protein